MLPQFGFIVAQAGAEYYSTLPPPSSTGSTNVTQPKNNHIHSPALAPLLLRSGTPALYSPQTSSPHLPPPSSLYHPMIEKEKKEWLQSTTNHPLETAVHPQNRQDYADLMSWMDHEFWEQTDELYQQKLLSLQHELVLLQKGTHTVFEQLMADYEIQREKSIEQAECFMNYQIAFVEHYFDQDLNALEDEYETERKHLQDTLISSIEDKRKQMKDDRHEDTHDEDTDSPKNRSKRTLRKRAVDSTNSSRNEPLSKRRQVRPSTMHNIHVISPLEDEELENEFLYMKKLATQESH